MKKNLLNGVFGLTISLMAYVKPASAAFTSSDPYYVGLFATIPQPFFNTEATLIHLRLLCPRETNRVSLKHKGGEYE